MSKFEQLQNQMYVTQHQTVLILDKELKMLMEREAALKADNEELKELLGQQT